MATQISPHFLHRDLGTIGPESIVEVTLTNAANVLLMDSVNFDNYRSGQAYRYHGGYIRSSPFRVRPPHSGHWHLVVDLGGGPGRVGASVRVVRGSAA